MNVETITMSISRNINKLLIICSILVSIVYLDSFHTTSKKHNEIVKHVKGQCIFYEKILQDLKEIRCLKYGNEGYGDEYYGDIIYRYSSQLPQNEYLNSNKKLDTIQVNINSMFYYGCGWFKEIDILKDQYSQLLFCGERLFQSRDASLHEYVINGDIYYRLPEEGFTVHISDTVSIDFIKYNYNYYCKNYEVARANRRVLEFNTIP